MYNLEFSRISKDTLGTFLLRFCAIFGTKLGGVLLFRVNFEKDVWLCLAIGFSPWRLVDGTAGAAAAQEQQEQQQHQRTTAPAAAASVLHYFGV